MHNGLTPVWDEGAVLVQLPLGAVLCCKAALVLVSVPSTVSVSVFSLVLTLFLPSSLAHQPAMLNQSERVCSTIELKSSRGSG
jgi:hypothetical protein